jgi:F0F1-type ATP synthase membrane subunit a
MASPPDRSPLTSPIPRLVRDWLVPIVELALRLAAIMLAAELLLSIPLPLEGTPLTFVHALIAFAAVTLVGITILETLFYDRYRP